MVTQMTARVITTLNRHIQSFIQVVADCSSIIHVAHTIYPFLLVVLGPFNNRTASIFQDVFQT